MQKKKSYLQPKPYNGVYGLSEENDRIIQAIEDKGFFPKRMVLYKRAKARTRTINKPSRTIAFNLAIKYLLRNPIQCHGNVIYNPYH